MSVDMKLCLKFSIDKNRMGINNWLKDMILELALGSDISHLPTESENTQKKLLEPIWIVTVVCPGDDPKLKISFKNSIFGQSS